MRRKFKQASFCSAFKRSLSRKGFLNLFNDFAKRGGIVDGHFGKRFSVEFDAGLLQAVDELAVPNAVHASGGVDSDDPQFAEFTFSDASVAKGEYAGAENGLFSRSR